MRRSLVALLLAAALGLGGCAGRPKNVLIPVAATAPGTSEVTLLVATTRSDRNAAPGEMFTGERGRATSFADITVSIPPAGNRKVGDVQWPKSLPGNPATDFVTVSATELDRAEAIASFDARVRHTPKRRVLVFVHGYNTRFEEAVYRFAQIVHDSGAPAVPVLFTWPSRGQLLSYGYDHESGSYSRDALEALLQAVTKDKNVGEVAILAHSMGNWVTLEALRQMAIRNGRVSPKINSIMLAAPDVDFDVFRRQIAEIGPQRPPVTIFISQDDQALAVSRRVWGQPRLGAINAEAEPYRTVLDRDQITVVDLTKVETDDRVKHGKFAQSPDVVRMIGQRLVEGQTLNDGRSGLGERLGQVAVGAASTVGSAASLAISAPIAIIDPHTREGLGGQFERLGSNMASTIPLPQGAHGQPSSQAVSEADTAPLEPQSTDAQGRRR
ncbi:alpha/beta hydrolase [Chelatococcus reniformis]|nr:alpha/beta hydrolase [Chelatococcus reniformis]